jgi:hypothetical protein
MSTEWRQRMGLAGAARARAGMAQVQRPRDVVAADAAAWRRAGLLAVARQVIAPAPMRRPVRKRWAVAAWSGGAISGHALAATGALAWAPTRRGGGARVTATVGAGQIRRHPALTQGRQSQTVRPDAGSVDSRSASKTQTAQFGPALVARVRMLPVGQARLGGATAQTNTLQPCHRLTPVMPPVMPPVLRRFAAITIVAPSMAWRAARLQAMARTGSMLAPARRSVPARAMAPITREAASSAMSCGPPTAARPDRTDAMRPADIGQLTGFVTDALARAASRPPIGYTGVDDRLTPMFAGTVGVL